MPTRSYLAIAELHYLVRRTLEDATDREVMNAVATYDIAVSVAEIIRKTREKKTNAGTTGHNYPVNKEG